MAAPRRRGVLGGLTVRPGVGWGEVRAAAKEGRVGGGGGAQGSASPASWTRLLGPVRGALGCRAGPRGSLVPLSPTLPPSEGTGGTVTTAMSDSP